jgi:Skp family chaperone for outer membrane proteins
MTYPAPRAWLILAALAVLVAAAAHADGPAPLIGKVDMDQVWRRYTRFNSLNEEFGRFKEQLEAKCIERQRSFPLLLKEEYNDLMELRKKGDKMTPDEQAKYKRLVNRSDDLDKEQARLQALPDDKLTDADRKRRKELADLQTQAQNEIAEMLKEAKELFAKRDAEIMGELHKDIDTAAAEVAKEKGLIAVVQADAVLFGGLDVTNDLIDKLNKMPAPPTPKPAT